MLFSATMTEEVKQAAGNHIQADSLIDSSLLNLLPESMWTSFYYNLFW